MTLSFDGKVAVATGVGGGLGRSHALELARRGAHVVGNDLGGDNAAAQQVVDEITAAGGEAVPSYDSVATSEGGKAIIQGASDTLGKVDIVIDDAGIFVGVTPGIVEHDLTVETMAERLAEIRNECVPSSAIHLLDV